MRAKAALPLYDNIPLLLDCFTGERIELGLGRDQELLVDGFDDNERVLLLDDVLHFDEDLLDRVEEVIQAIALVGLKRLAKNLQVGTCKID